MHRTIWLALLLAVALPGTKADAAFKFTFDQPTYNVAVGGTVDVTVSIADDGGSDLATQGLLGVGVGIRWTAGGLLADTGTNVTVAPAFDTLPFLSQVLDTTDPAFSGSNRIVAVTSVNFFDATVVQGSAIEIATLHFTGLAAGTMTISADVVDPAGTTDFILLGDGATLLDRTSHTAASADVVVQGGPTVAPEPGSWVLLAIGAGCLLGLARRERRRRALA